MQWWVRECLVVIDGACVIIIEEEIRWAEICLENEVEREKV